MDLNPHNSFSLPLRSQPLALVGLALRTVTLPSVETVKGMAVLAVRLLRVHVAAPCGVSFGVFRRRERVQVLMVDARPVPAGVINNVALWNRAAAHPQRNSVSLSVGPAQVEDAVPVAVKSAVPYQAITLLGALAEKPLSFLLCSVHSRLLKTARMAPQVLSVGELS